MGDQELNKELAPKSDFNAPHANDILILFPQYREAALARGLTAGTTASVRCDVNKLAAWMSEREIASVEHLGSKQLKDFQNWLAAYVYSVPGKPKDRMKAATRAKSIANIRSFLKWCYRTERTALDLSRHLVTPRTPQPLPRDIPRPKDVATLIRAQLRRRRNRPEGLRNAAMLAILFACGLRRKELVSLKLEDVDIDEREVRVVAGKGNRGRTVPMAPWARDLAKAYLKDGRAAIHKGAQDNGPFFIRPDGKGIHPDQLNRIFPSWCRQARLGRRLTPHAFRHAFCVYLLKGGASIRVVNELAGHQKLSVTARYTRLTTGDLARVMEKSHPGWRP